MKYTLVCDQCGREDSSGSGWCILSRMMYSLGRPVEKGLHVDLCASCSAPFLAIEKTLKEKQAALESQSRKEIA
jgi:hypothetical protein